MNTPPRQKPELIRDKIVWLACQIWQAGEVQTDLNQEYWQKARQLLAVSRDGQDGRSQASK